MTKLKDLNLDVLSAETVSAQFCSDHLKSQILELLKERDWFKAQTMSLRGDVVTLSDALARITATANQVASFLLKKNGIVP